MSQTEVQLIKDSAVVTADIADQAVTLDKLPHGTSSNNGKFLRANNGADPSFETVTTTTINNNADNRIITGSGTADTLNAESEFTFDGSNILCRAGEGGNASLNLIADEGDDNGDGWKIQSEQDENDLTFKSNISGSYVDKLKLKSSGQLECQGNLEVSGTITPTGNVVIPDTIVHTGDSNTKIRFPAADTFTVETAGSERARIDSQGRFLINTSSYKSNLNASADSSGQISQFIHTGDNINGCLSVFAYSGSTSPTTRGAKLQLHRARSSDGSTNTILSNGDLIGSIEFKGNDGANFTAAARIDVMVDGGTGADDMPGRIQFFTSADGSGAPSERMRIDSAGNVLVRATGINNSSVDGQALQVSGTTRPTLILRGNASGSNVAEIQFADNSGSDSDPGTQAGLIRYDHHGGNIMSFHRNETEGFRMGAAENIFIHSQNSSGSNGRIYTNKGNVNATTLEVNQNAGSGTEMITFRNSGTQLGTIHQSGSSGVSYQSNSDYRLKENDVVISDGITRLKQLRPIRFNWKADTSTVVDGFFAHEVSPVVPEAVRGNKDEVFDTDGIGTQVKGGPKYQQLEQSKLIPLLTAALQEEITKREALQTRVAALEAT